VRAWGGGLGRRWDAATLRAHPGPSPPLHVTAWPAQSGAGPCCRARRSRSGTQPPQRERRALLRRRRWAPLLPTISSPMNGAPSSITLAPPSPGPRPLARPTAGSSPPPLPPPPPAPRQARLAASMWCGGGYFALLPWSSVVLESVPEVELAAARSRAAGAGAPAGPATPTAEEERMARVRAAPCSLLGVGRAEGGNGRGSSPGTRFQAGTARPQAYNNCRAPPSRPSGQPLPILPGSRPRAPRPSPPFHPRSPAQAARRNPSPEQLFDEVTATR
jgi:hypothetical protein